MRRKGELGHAMCVTPGPRLLRGRLRVAEEVGVGRKMILLLGWLTRGVRFVSLSRCSSVRCVMADGWVRLVSGLCACGR